MPRNPDWKNFDAWGRRIRALVEKAASAEADAAARRHTLAPSGTADGKLLIQCYGYFRRLKAEGQLPALAEHLAADPGDRWVRHPRVGVENVLRLLEPLGAPELISPSRRSRIAKKLSFADRLDIHPHLLLGFLYEAGPHESLLESSKAATLPSWATNYQRVSDLYRSDIKRRHKGVLQKAQSVAPKKKVRKS